MSAIATFFLVRNEDIARLKDLATHPVGPSGRKRWHDPYWEFLRANARELEAYEWSGHVIASEVYFYLRSRSVPLGDYCDRELSDFLCAARGSSILAFHAEGGGQLARLIERPWPDEAAIEAFLHSPEMTSPTGEVVPIEAVFDGLRVLKNWLAHVDGDHVGLLTIG
jgi:hypothetical protein